MEPGIVAEIRAQLRSLEASHGVGIPIAVESGSRAWGFPSPDSDYDCRFIYLCSQERMYSIFPRRDVIELPLTEVFDINGWELAKALRLLLAGNAIVYEWLQSPHCYVRNDAAWQMLHGFAEEVFDRDAARRHYFYLLRSQIEKHIGDRAAIAVKKLFYVLRPAMALRYLRHNPGPGLVPMDFSSLCAGASVPLGLMEIINDMLARMAVTRELGTTTAPPELLAFGIGELELARTVSPVRLEASPELRRKADALHIEMIRQFAPR